jgi:hypothetical protein
LFDSVLIATPCFARHSLFRQFVRSELNDFGRLRLKSLYRSQVGRTRTYIKPWQLARLGPSGYATK